MADIVLVNPAFEPSYWGLEYGLPLLRKKAAMPVAGLPLLAALTPAHHQVTIVDENVEPLDFDRLARADIVGVTGMSVQRARMRAVLEELKRRRAFTVVGGPWVTVAERYFGALADVIVVGEAEESWPRFLEEWEHGAHRPRYEQADRTDMTAVPVPRYDQLRFDRYLFGSVQLSRGCPFQCEFCDIIVTFGRRPRLKTAEQVLAELDALRRLGPEVVFIVDDNLIGNKKGITPLLEAIRDWQRAHGYPFVFTAEASLDLAEDEDLMRLMLDANLLSVFIGVESPSEEALRETRKYQNVRRGDSLIDRVWRVQRAGLEVWCGMIVGFDDDDRTIFGRQFEFLQRARISQAMVGMLTAIPKTPLYDRLSAAGRLDEVDGSPYGTNVIPLRMTRAELSDGFVRLMRDLYEPAAYFARVNDLIENDTFAMAPALARYWRAHPWARAKGAGTALLKAGFVYARLMRQVDDPELRAVYRRQVRRLLRRRPSALLVLGVLVKCVMHFHHYTLAKNMAEGPLGVVNSY